MDVSLNNCQDYLNATGQRVLDEEDQSKLREILKCAVCLEIPKGNDQKIRTCEQGHHFCSPCYKYLRNCAVCRGQFFRGRNFVVEELVSQLGSTLGFTKTPLPLPGDTPKLAPGIYQCLHSCTYQLSAGSMLNHLRKKHNKNLIDNVRSNPYLKRFDWLYQVPFILDKKNVLSVQISDMGLFTVVLNVTSEYLFGTLHMLGNSDLLSTFECKLTVKVNKTECSHEFSISNCNLFEYKYDNTICDSGRCLKIETKNLTELLVSDNAFEVLFSIWRRDGKKTKNNFEIIKVLPELPVLYQNDRKQRRNRKRNLRKKLVKSGGSGLESDRQLTKKMAKLTLECNETAM